MLDILYQYAPMMQLNPTTIQHLQSRQEYVEQKSEDVTMSRSIQIWMNTKAPETFEWAVYDGVD